MTWTYYLKYLSHYQFSLTWQYNLHFKLTYSSFWPFWREWKHVEVTPSQNCFDYGHFKQNHKWTHFIHSPQLNHLVKTVTQRQCCSVGGAGLPLKIPGGRTVQTLRLVVYWCQQEACKHYIKNISLFLFKQLEKIICFQTK